MSKEVTKIEVKAVIPLTADQEKEIDTYLVSLGTTLRPEQLQQFKTLCREFQLNPFKREIYGVPYGKKFNIIVGYEVYMKRANRSGLMNGMERGTKGQGEDLVAWIKIFRKDWDYPFYHEVDYNEYVQYGKDYNTGEWGVNKMWKGKPKTMLLKVATAQAFRLCFPEDFAGMPYTSDEMPLKDDVAGLQEVKPVKTIDKPGINLKSNEIPLTKQIPEQTIEKVNIPIQNLPIKTGPIPQKTTQTPFQIKKENFWNMLVDLHCDNASQVLENMTAFRTKDNKDIPGKRDVSRMSEKQIGFLFRKVEAEWKKLGKNKPGEFVDKETGEITQPEFNPPPPTQEPELPFDNEIPDWD